MKAFVTALRLCLMVVLPVICLPLGVWAQEGKPEVAIELKLPRTKFVQGEPIRALVTVRVTGTRPVRIPLHWGETKSPGEQFLYRVVTSESKVIINSESRGLIEDDFSLEPRPIRYEALIPGEVRTYETDLLNEAHELFTTNPGTHTVSVELQEVLVADEASSFRLVSSPANFEIQEPTGVNLESYLYMYRKLEFRTPAPRFYESLHDWMQHILDRFPGSLYAAYIHFGNGEKINSLHRFAEVPHGRLHKSEADTLRLAIEHYRKAVTKYPSFQFKDRARFRMAEMLFHLREYFPARREATIVRDTAVDYDLRRKARFLLLKIPELEKAAAQEQQKK